MAEILMTTPYGEHVVRRPHTAASSPLRGWSAADQMVLDELGTDDLGSVLVVNDEFGALSVGLATAVPTVWTDSALSRSAIDSNLWENGLEGLDARAVAGDEFPTGSFDTVVVRVPKSSDLLDHQLAAIAGCVRPDTRVIGCAMARHVHRSTVRSFEHWIGRTTTSKAVRKARLIHSTVKSDDRTTRALLSEQVVEFTTPEGVVVAELPGTFSAGHLDAGTALLLDTLQSLPHLSDSTVPTSPSFDNGNRLAAVVLDLGCGNGVIAATLARRWPETQFVLTDVSDLAIASARHTWQSNDLAKERVSLQVADGLTAVADATIDLVVTNPPFHQGHALDADLTDRLLADVARVLTAEGCAYVVAQRHLNLHTRLRRWFDNVEVVSKHPGFVVLCAT